MAWAQSFGGLGSKAADEFATPQRNFVFDFPADHGAHPDYRIEWWYLTANLEDLAGVQYPSTDAWAQSSAYCFASGGQCKHWRLYNGFVI